MEDAQDKQGAFKRCLILSGIMQQKNWQLYVGYSEGIKVSVTKSAVKDLIEDGIFAWVRAEDVDTVGKTALVRFSVNPNDFDPVVKTVHDLLDAPRAVLSKRWATLASEMDPKSY